MNGNDKVFRIFIVDDEDTIAITTATILRNAGFEAVPFSDPCVLLGFCIESPPDLVISDVVMPQMNGFELANYLLEIQPRCEILLFTGHAGVVELQELSTEQGHDLLVLAKPIHPEDLIAKVRSLADTEQGT